MIKRIRTTLIPLSILALAACSSQSTHEDQQMAGGKHLSEGAKGQFQCADRNSNHFVDRSELVFMRQCGIGENLECGGVMKDTDRQSSSEEFEAGRRMLEVMDVDGDNRISPLEFRAHCNDVGQAE